MSVIESIVISVFDVFEYLIMFMLILRRQELKSHWGLIVLVVSAVFSGHLSSVVSGEVAFYLNSIILIPFVMWSFDLKPTKAIVVYGLSTAGLIILQLSALIVLNVIGLTDHVSFESALIGHMLTGLVLLLGYRFIPFHILLSKELTSNKVFSFVITNIVALSAGIFIYWKTSSVDFITNILSFLSIMSILIVMNILLFTKALNTVKDQKKMEMYEAYIPIIEDLLNDIRGKQHEYDNHLQSLYSAMNLEASNISAADEAREYLDELKKESNKISVVKLSNKVLAGLIFSKIRLCDTLGITCKIEIEDYLVECRLKRYEVVEVVGILLDNAIEATEAGQEIMLKIAKKNGIQQIEVRNQHQYLSNTMIEKMFQQGYTTKATGNRGYGLYHLNNIIKGNKCKCYVENLRIDDENHVSFKIHI